MFDCDAPQFCDLENPELNDDLRFFESYHPNQDKTPKQRKIGEFTPGRLTKSAKKHSMFTRLDAANDVLILRSRSVPRASGAALQVADGIRKRISALKNHSINTLTVPDTPLLLTKMQTRPTEVLSYEDRVPLEIDKFNSYEKTKTIPLPLQRNILDVPPAINLPHISTVPEPFNIPNYVKKEITQEKTGLFVFTAQPLPQSNYNKKQQALVKPFAETYLLRRNKKATKENHGGWQSKKFKAKRAKVLYESPFKPKKSSRPPLTPINIVLHTAIRAQIRKEFDEGRAERLRKHEEMMQQFQRDEALKLKKFRNQLVHKSLPLPNVHLRKRKRSTNDQEEIEGINNL